MTSTVTDTSSLIDATYPIPGVDNNTQGFRNNFASIKYAFSATAAEITDLQVIQTGLIQQIDAIVTPSTLTLVNLTATNIVATTVTAVQFVGDGSLLTNIQSNIHFNEFTATTIVLNATDPADPTSASISVGNNRLLLNGVGGLAIVGTSTVSHILQSYGGVGPGLYDNYLTFDSVADIDVGYTFRLYNTETSAHTVLSVNTVTNTITTDPFDPTVAQALGIGNGSYIYFTEGYAIGSASYASNAPTTAIGKITDRKGSIFANSTTFYACYSDYDGVNPIWNIIDKSTFGSASTLAAVQTQVNTNTSNISTLQTQVNTNTNNIGVLQSQTAALNTATNSLQTQINNLGVVVTQVNTNTSDISLLKSQVSTNTTNIATNTSNISVLTTQVNTNTSAISNIQSTMVKYATSAPLTSVGVAGDTKGTIFATTNTLYICNSDYNGGNIWSKVSITGGTW